MSAAVSVPRLDEAARARVLAALGIDQFVRRTRNAPSSPSTATTTATASPHHAAASSGSPNATAPSAAITFVCDPAEAGDDPAAGRYGKLLAHVALALGVRLSAVRFAATAGDGPALCFGVAAGDGVDVRLAPPLATLRGSARARLALWQDLRELARRRRA